MRIKAVVPLVLALGLGLLAAYLFRDVVNSRLAGPRPGATGKAVVVRQDVPLGHELRAQDLMLVDTPAKLAAKGSFTAVEKAVGRVLVTPVVQGQLLVETMLAPEGSLAGLQAMVPKGMRAVTIDINEVTGLAGLIVPGSFVDVVTTLRDEVTKDTIGRTILQNVRVSAIGQRITPKTDVKGTLVNELSKSATLIVTPAQAESLDLAATRGKLRLVLRNSSDTAEVETRGVKLTSLVQTRGDGSGMLGIGRSLLGQFASTLQQAKWTPPPPPPPAPVASPSPATQPAPQRMTVQIIRAGTESTKEFQVVPASADNESAPATSGNPVETKVPIGSASVGGPSPSGASVAGGLH